MFVTKKRSFTDSVANLGLPGLAEPTLIYDISNRFSLHDLRSRLAGSYRIEDDPPTHVIRSYLDTFDWRMYRSGLVFEVSAAKQGYQIVWRQLQTGDILLSQVVRQIPRFSWDAQAPGIRERMQAVMQMRALEDKVPVHSDVQTLRLLDDEGKTVLRLELRSDRVVLAQSAKQIALPPRLYVIPYRGYEKIRERVLHRLGAKAGLSPVDEDPLVSALKAVGLKPGAYRNRPRYHVQPGQAAEQAVRGMLEELHALMQTNLDGACRDADSEFLHDFRAAVVRSALLIDKAEGLFPESTLRFFRDEFTWLDKITRPTRQVDIYLLLFESYEKRLPASLRRYLDPFREYLKDHKRLEHSKLKVGLLSPRYRALEQRWQSFLSAPQPKSDAAPSRIDALARELTWDCCQHLLAQGGAIDRFSPPGHLLSMYETIEQLGFLLEFFSELYDARKIAAVSQPLNRLGRVLDAFRDLEMQQITLRKFRDEMRSEERLTRASMEAMDHLVADLAEQERVVREEFGGRYRKFNTKKTRKRLRAMFGPTSKAQEQDSK